MLQRLVIPIFTLFLLTSTAALAEEIPCTHAGPQAPRDISHTLGSNPVTFSTAPSFNQMQLCDIHFHRFAEHKGPGFSTKAGEGKHAGYACEGSTPPANDATSGDNRCEGTRVGDSIEVHWVFTTCDVEPGPTLNSCFSPVCANPQVRVEAKVFHLTDGEEGELDFAHFANAGDIVLPNPAGAVQYMGSSTGAKYNNDSSCSPFQITWNVRPTCSPLSIASLDAWCGDNVFNENKAHDVRPLVTPLKLRSRIN
ncbi:MAG: delta-class carbonic anhydrase [Acidobacteriota bacterium]